MKRWLTIVFCIVFLASGTLHAALHNHEIKQDCTVCQTLKTANTDAAAAVCIIEPTTEIHNKPQTITSSDTEELKVIRAPPSIL